MQKLRECKDSILFGLQYDGKKETLPMKGFNVVLLKDGHEYFVRSSEDMTRWLFDCKSTDSLPIEIGDTFIYLADIPIYMRRGEKCSNRTLPAEAIREAAEEIVKSTSLCSGEGCWAEECPHEKCVEDMDKIASIIRRHMEGGE